MLGRYTWRHSWLGRYNDVKRKASTISYRINLPRGNFRSMPRGSLPSGWGDDIKMFDEWKNDGCPYSRNDPAGSRIVNDNNINLINKEKTRAIGPAWTLGEIEAPKGTKNMGTWIASVYTEEQQKRD